MKPKLYLETTIPSYLAAWPSRDLIVAGHQQITHTWWRKRREDFQIFVSQLVLVETGRGNKEAAAERLALIQTLPRLDITVEVDNLTALFLKDGILPDSAAVDAAHIAVAAIHGMDFLMTWNCSHIANAEIYGRLAKVCAEQGFNCPVICTPEELVGD